jgi:hypothetical protein
MSQYRNALPQLTGGLFLTDGGIETTLIFHEGLELPDFAAFRLLSLRKVKRFCISTFARMRRSRSGSALA